MAQVSDTKVIAYYEGPRADETPLVLKLPQPPNTVTLGDLKKILPICKPNSEYFFKTVDPDVPEGPVRAKVESDEELVPLDNNRIVVHIRLPEDWNASDSSQSQITDVSGMPRRRRPYRDMSSVSDAYTDDTTTCTETETESMISSRRDRGHRYPRHRRHRHCDYDDSSVLTSDDTSFVYSGGDEYDNETISQISTTTDETSVSRINPRRRRRRHRRMASISRATSESSMSDTTGYLDTETIILQIDANNPFLGLSIAGQSEHGGIFVAQIQPGGAVQNDGRIKPGDMLLAVNDIPFDDMTNDEAVAILKREVQKQGPIKMIIAKGWEERREFFIEKSEPIQPIDPGAWVAHTEAQMARDIEYPLRPPSASTFTSTSSSITSSLPESERPLTYENTPLTVHMDKVNITKWMAAPDSGLEIRDRQWLKITIPNAFLGSDVVNWLYSHLQGFEDRRQAKKFAAEMLKEGFIKHTTNKNKFREQCYYTFGDNIASDIQRMRLLDDDQSSERDILLGSMPPSVPINAAPSSPWHARSNIVAPQPTVYPSTVNFQGPPVQPYRPWNGTGADSINYGGFGAPMPSAIGSNSIISAGSGNDRLLLNDRHSGTGSPSASEHNGSQRSGPILMTSFKNNYPQPHPQQPPLLSSFGQARVGARSDPPQQVRSSNGTYANSCQNGRDHENDHSSEEEADEEEEGSESGSSSHSGSINSQRRQVEVLRSENGTDGRSSNGQLDSLSADLTGSRQSFRMAMGNPCDFVHIDIM